jgi:TolA-binding protein
MKQIITTAAVAAALWAGAAAPAAAQNKEHQQQAAELRILQEQQVQLALSIEKLAQSLTEAVKAFNTRIDQTNERITKGFADQGLVLGPIGRDAQIMRERSQETSTRIGELTAEVRALRGDVQALAARPIMVAPPPDPLDPNAPAPLNPSTTQTIPPPAAAPVALGLSPAQVFGQATGDYANGLWDVAVEGFQTFLKNWPTDDRADDAQQGIGDALYSSNKFEEAIAAYNLVIQNYPKGDQVGWAYYKRAIVQVRLGRNADALASYQLAIKTGDEAVAQLAKQRLDGMTRAAAPPPAAQKP